MASHDIDQNPDQEAASLFRGIAFGTIEFDQNGLPRSSVAVNQSPESDQNYSGVDFLTGVDGVEFNDVSGDGSVRKEDEGVVMVSDHVYSVSESLDPPVAGEYSGEGVKNSNEKVNNRFDFHKLAPFDFNVSIVEDAPARNGYSGDGQRLSCLNKDANFSNIWSNQGSLSCNPFGNHPQHTLNAKVDGFPMGGIDDMMSGLTVRDLISSSNALALSASLKPSHGLAGTHQYINNINLNSQISHYPPLPTMTCLSSGHSLSPNSVLDPLGIVNSYNGLVRRQVGPDQYTYNGPASPSVGRMMTDLSLGASSSFSKNHTGLKLNWKMKKQMLEMSMSRDGSRCLLDLISNANPTDIATILDVVESDVHTIIADEHGYKVFSHLLEFCDPAQKESLLNRIVSDSIAVILRVQTSYGSKALIKLVDHLSWSEQTHKVPSILASEIKPMLFDRFAGFVIQHCLNVLNPKQNELLIEALIECSCSLALDVHLCSFLYNLIDRLKGVHWTRLLNKLSDNSVKLAFHSSGNYVVKRMLDLKDIRISRKISYILKGHYKSLAIDKHGSHVVEACLQSVGIHFVMHEFLNMRPDELEQLACHRFGNYVIKKALEATSKCCLSYHDELVWALLQGLARIKESPHGKNVYQKLKDETRFRNGRTRSYDGE